MAKQEKAASPQYRRVYMDIPIETDDVLAIKARSLQISKKALLERLILEFVKPARKVKK